MFAEATTLKRHPVPGEFKLLFGKTTMHLKVWSLSCCRSDHALVTFVHMIMQPPHAKRGLLSTRSKLSDLLHVAKHPATMCVTPNMSGFDNSKWSKRATCIDRSSLSTARITWSTFAVFLQSSEPYPAGRGMQDWSQHFILFLPRDTTSVKAFSLCHLYNKHVCVSVTIIIWYLLFYVALKVNKQCDFLIRCHWLRCNANTAANALMLTAPPLN